MCSRLEDRNVGSLFCDLKPRIKVWPRDIEDVLYTHPAVREAAVVGIPDAYRGEAVKAVVGLKPGAVDIDDLIAVCRERMAAYKNFARRIDA